MTAGACSWYNVGMMSGSGLMRKREFQKEKHEERAMAGYNTIVQALGCMWKSESNIVRHGARADADIQYEMTGDTLSARKYVGDWESRTVYSMYLSRGTLAGFRRAVSLLYEGKNDPEFIDRRLKSMIAASCEKYNNGAIGHALGLGLSLGAGVMLIVLLSGKALGEAPLWAWLAGIAVCGLGLWLTYRPGLRVRNFWAGCSLETEEATLQSLEKLEAFLRK